MEKTIDKVLAMDTYCICELKMSPLQTLLPKSASFMHENGKMTSAPLEKMAPFMSEDLQTECVFR